ncbi:hypothetical protein ACILD6_05880 [Capnocytophaga canimorsus]|uniref:Uncharacterized protein n=1 Tax=Capnocytophaga canimorsus TaxID=28188 RepID=A0A0B7ILV0_9FLAO|nr:hypothetical protein [Capnocytophaga canimorsus]CEN52881.1 hypothetical protein CCAN11_30010 [Capnocytophaga canimorsus]
MTTKRRKTSKRELYTKVVGKTGITFRKVSVKSTTSVSSKKKTTRKRK